MLSCVEHEKRFISCETIRFEFHAGMGERSGAQVLSPSSFVIEQSTEIHIE